MVCTPRPRPRHPPAPMRAQKQCRCQYFACQLVAGCDQRSPRFWMMTRTSPTPPRGLPARTSLSKLAGRGGAVRVVRTSPGRALLMETFKLTVSVLTELRVCLAFFKRGYDSPRCPAQVYLSRCADLWTAVLHSCFVASMPMWWLRGDVPGADAGTWRDIKQATKGGTRCLDCYCHVSGRACLARRACALNY